MKQYFAVMYLNGGNAVISKAYDSEDEVREKMGKFIENHPDEVKATTFITRETEKEEPLSIMEVLGHPRSRDLMQDKKFLKSLKA